MGVVKVDVPAQQTPDDGQNGGMVQKVGKNRIAADEVGEEEVLVRAQTGGHLIGPDVVGGSFEGRPLCCMQHLGHDQKALRFEVPTVFGGDEVLQASRVHELTSRE